MFQRHMAKVCGFQAHYLEWPTTQEQVRLYVPCSRFTETPTGVSTEVVRDKSDYTL